MYDIFISYRRDGGHEMARLLYEHLCAKQLDCFFDLEELGSGEFNVKLLDNIDAAENFVLVLSPGALERCRNEGDWVRQEIEHAIKRGKNIVPLMLSGFDWPRDLPKTLEKLPFYNGVSLIREYFDASLAKLIGLLALEDTKKERALKLGNAPLGGVASWLERAFVFLEDREWEKADTYAEKVLDTDPKNEKAYLVKLMIALRVCVYEGLKHLKEPFDHHPAYQTLLRYAGDELKAELAAILDGIRAEKEKALETAYIKALDKLRVAKDTSECEAAAREFAALGTYKDSAERVKECYALAGDTQKGARYLFAEEKAKEGTVTALLQAATVFQSLGEYKDSAARAKACREEMDRLEKEEGYARAEAVAEEDTVSALREAMALFCKLDGYRDSAARADACRVRIEALEKEPKYLDAAAKMKKGTVTALSQAKKIFGALGEYKDSPKQVQACREALLVFEKEAKYARAEALAKEGAAEALEDAAALFASLGDFKDAAARAEKCGARLKGRALWRKILPLALLGAAAMAILVLLLI